jgi:mannose-6-phosphate isomerase-like protein (cupin superfamily)
LEGQEIIKTSGQTMMIPMKTFHTFCNASPETELVIEFVLQPKWKDRDEAFFRRCTFMR